MSPTGCVATTKPTLSIVVPVYHEAENIQPFLQRIEGALALMTITYEIIFCLDPSADNTQTIIETEINRNPNIKLLVFSRRFGQPAATMAGILYCQGNACVVIDVDLQDPPELIPALWQKLQTGYAVVYAQRRSRQGETLIKKLITHLGYKIINRLTDVNIPRNTGDFRIISRQIIEELRRLNETHNFLRGLVAFVGFKQTAILYDRASRHKGQGHYNRFIGSLKIAANGLIAFSNRPLQLIILLGAILLGSSCVFAIITKFAGGNLSFGIIVSFFSGIQLFCLGLMGEYVGRIYDEVKRRPLYIIDQVITHPSVK
jgi:glycosyltransferase involved in cell wall biosynthesis